MPMLRCWRIMARQAAMMATKRGAQVQKQGIARAKQRLLAMLLMFACLAGTPGGAMDSAGGDAAPGAASP